MTRAECKVGLVVQLISGGPKMVINGIFAEDYGMSNASERTYCAQCTWFDVNGHKKLDNFRPETLSPAEAPHPYR